MIIEFSAQPKATNNNAKALMWVFFAIAAVAFGVTAFISVYQGVIGMVALGSITTAILMYTKYVSVKFYYDVLSLGLEEPLFVVRQTVGKREVTLARVALADITAIERESKAERRAHKRTKGVFLYCYAPTLSPEESYRMYVKTRHETSEIVLEGTEEFFNKIKEYIEEAKQIRAELDLAEEY